MIALLANPVRIEPMFLRLFDAAELMGLSVSMVRKMARSGQLPVRRFGRSVRIPRAAIEALVNATVTSGGAWANSDEVAGAVA